MELKTMDFTSQLENLRNNIISYMKENVAKYPEQEAKLIEERDFYEHEDRYTDILYELPVVTLTDKHCYPFRAYVTGVFLKDGELYINYEETESGAQSNSLIVYLGIEILTELEDRISC